MVSYFSDDLFYLFMVCKFLMKISNMNIYKRN